MAVTGSMMTTGPAAAAAPADDVTSEVAAAVASLPEATLDQAPDARRAEPAYDVLVFSRTAGFRHDSIPAGIRAVQRLGAQYGFTVTATEDPGAFTAANLDQYEAVIWLSTTSDVLNAAQQTAFEGYIQGGGGYVGVHAASDTEYTWPWYGELVGAYFQSHPAGTPTATIDVEDFSTPSSCALPERWERTDEWYNFQSKDDPVVGGGGLDYSPRGKGNIKVIATLDESTYVENDGNATDDDHPIAWYQEFDGGRSFYTGGGHTQASFSEPLFQLHLLGGIQYAADQAPDADACTEPPPTDASFEQVTLAKGVDKVGEPMSISVLPDGRVLHNARDGRIFLTDLSGNTTELYDVPIYSHDEDGLQSLTVSPNFAEDGWVYLYYAPPLSTPAGDAPNEGTAADFARFQGYNRLSRMKMVDDELVPSTEQELLRVEADRGICCHAGGAIDFDAQGNLYLSTGDDSNPFASDGFAPLDERTNRNPAYDAQRSSANSNDLRGKVLRITPDAAAATYTVPDGNLFPEASDTAGKTRPEIYAMGFRNPFRMTVDKETGYVYLGEYGPDAGSANPNRGPGGIVEFNQIRRAGNFGWPYCTGLNTTAETYNDWNFATNATGPKFDCTAPVNNSPHNTGLTTLPPAQPAWIKYDGGAVTYNGTTTDEFGNGGEGPMAGPVYNYDPDLDSDVKFPEYFDNHFFAGEWTRGWIKDIALDGEGDVSSISPFFDSSTLYAAMDMEFGPDGSLYVLDYGNGGYFTGNENSAVYKINAINAGARAPSAVATATPDSGSSPLTVQFSSEGSSDPDEGDSIASYAWDFQNDDVVDSTVANPTFTYQTPGVYDARLTVTDTTGRTGVATAVVTVGNTRPTVEIELPPNGGFFEFGDSVRVKVNVTDPEDGTIDCDKVQIDYVLGHDSHGHPLSSATGCDVVLKTVRDEGHDASADIFGVINASYTDSGANGVRALSGEDEVVLQPKRKQAEHFDTQQGVATEATTDPQGGARNVSNIDAGDYVSYAPISLSRVPELRFRVASAGAGGTIEARLDSPTGPLAGSVDVPVTGGWQSWRTVSMDVAESAQTGSHQLFLVFKNTNPAATGLFNVNFFDAAGQGVSENSKPQVSVEATPTQGAAPLEVDFTGTASDFDGDALTYAWDFGVAGDADTATTANATYTYMEPGTYTARLTVTDAQGATGTATVPVRVLASCGDGSVDPSDEFEGTALEECRWNANVREDPSLYTVENGALTIRATLGDLYQGSDASAARNILLQSADNTTEDYSIETRVSTTFTDGYGQAGLIIYGDDDNYVKLDPIADTNAGRVNRIEFRSESGATILNPQPELAAPANVSSYRLKVTKTGTSYVAQAAFDGGDWQNVGTVTNPAVGMDFGVFALGVQQADRTATFDYLKVEGTDQNRAPVAGDDTVTTRQDTPVNVPVLAGDTDADGDTLSVASATDPAHGATAVNANGTVRYTPDAAYVGADTFDYVVSDGQGGTDTGTVRVTVVEDCGLTTPDDTFEGTALDDCRWNAIVAEDTDGYRVADGRLSLTTTEGEIYQGGTSKSNLVLQSADHAGTDWTIETAADVTGLDGGYSQAGLMAYGSDSDYVKVVAISDEGVSAPNRIELRSEVGDVIVGGDPQPQLTIPAGADLTDLRLRLVKAGTTYTGSVSFDGAATWVDLPRTVQNAMGSPRFGVFAAGVQQSGDEVSFDSFVVDGPDPVEPEPEPQPVADTRITAAPTGTVRSRTATVRFAAIGAGAPGATFQCTLDGSAWAACASPRALRNLGDGRHTLGVRAVNAGGTDATPATATWTVDATGPRIRAVGPKGGVRDRTPRIRAVVTDATSSVRARDLALFVDGRQVSGVTYDATRDRMTWTPKKAMSRGRHTVRLVALDTAGNRTATTWRFRVR